MSIDAITSDEEFAKLREYYSLNSKSLNKNLQILTFGKYRLTVTEAQEN